MMLTRKEQAELHMGTVLEKMQQATGKTLEELQSADQSAAKLADVRREALNIPFPEPKDSAIKLAQHGISSRGYRARRVIPGKGIGQNAVIGLDIWTSVAIESDNKLWFHASITRHDGKMPTYEDLCWLKEAFFTNTWAMQYFPPPDQHISHHHKCLHLWTCLEAFEVPDFRKLGTI